MRYASVTLVAVLALLALLGWVWLVRRRPATAALVVLGWACFSAHVLALGYRLGVSAEVVRALIPVKDVLAGVLAMVLVLKAVKGGGFPRMLVGALCLALLSGLTGLVAGLRDWTVEDMALSMRNAGVPVEAALTGLLLNSAERARVVRIGVWLVAAATAAALVEYALPLTFVRDVIGVGHYWVDVKQQTYHISPQGTGLPGNFFTSDGARRLSGPFGDPLSAGYAIAVALVAALLARHCRWTWPLVALLSVSLLLTFTRGGWLIATGSLVPIVATTFVQQRWRERGLMVAGGLAVVGAVLAIPAFRGYVAGIISGRDDSTKGHLTALLHIDDYAYSAFGKGWGAAGGAVGRGTESVLVTLALQIGLVGLALYVAALVLLVIQIGRRWSAGGLLLPFLGFAAAVLVTMLVSEQLLTFNAGWILILLPACSPAGRDAEHQFVLGPWPRRADAREG